MSLSKSLPVIVVALAAVAMSACGPVIDLAALEDMERAPRSRRVAPRARTTSFADEVARRRPMVVVPVVVRTTVAPRVGTPMAQADGTVLVPIGNGGTVRITPSPEQRVAVAAQAIAMRQQTVAIVTPPPRMAAPAPAGPLPREIVGAVEAWWRERPPPANARTIAPMVVGMAPREELREFNPPIPYANTPRQVPWGQGNLRLGFTGLPVCRIAIGGVVVADAPNSLDLPVQWAWFQVRPATDGTVEVTVRCPGVRPLLERVRAMRFPGDTSVYSLYDWTRLGY